MRSIKANGATIQIPDKCDCGATCPDEIAADHVHDWNKSGKHCSFCGELIRVVSFTMKHYHKEGDEPERWSSADWAEYEPNWSWFESGMFGRVAIEAHASCAKKAMRYANFEKIIYSIDRPKEIADAEMPKEIVCAGPCLMCGVVPTDEDIRRVAALIFNFKGPCVYCGKRIKLRSLTLFHGDLCGRHLGRWHFSDYEFEATLHWRAYSEEVKQHLEFVGHLECAHKAMPHAVWYEVNEAFWALLTGRGTN